MPSFVGILSKEEKAFNEKGKKVSLIRSSFPPKLDTISIIFESNEKIRYLGYLSLVVGDIICDNENRQRFSVVEVIQAEEMEDITVIEKKEKIAKQIACKVAVITKIKF